MNEKSRPGEKAAYPNETTTSILPRVYGQISFTPHVDEYIENLATDLVLGHLEGWQLPDCLATFYWFAWHAGRESRETEIANLNARADNLYLQAYSPKERAEMIQRRLDDHFTREADALFAEWTR